VIHVKDKIKQGRCLSHTSVP